MGARQAFVLHCSFIFILLDPLYGVWCVCVSVTAGCRFFVVVMCAFYCAHEFKLRAIASSIFSGVYRRLLDSITNRQHSAQHSLTSHSRNLVNLTEIWLFNTHTVMAYEHTNTLC